MQIQAFKKSIAITLLALLVTSIHFLLFSIDFYDSHRLVKKFKDRTDHRPTIAALWANAKTSANLSNQTSSSNKSISELSNESVIPMSTPVRKSIFSYGNKETNSQAEQSYLNAQKMREVILRNEQLSMRASTQTAMRELKEIVFQNSKKSSLEQKNCCVVAAIQFQASCSTAELSAFYQSIFESLRSRLEYLAREGINEFCE